MDEAISRQEVIKKLDEALESITKDVSKESDVYHIIYGTIGIIKCMIMTIHPEPHWHPVSEQPQEEDDYLLLTYEKFKHGTFKRIIIGAWNSATKEWLEEYGDMYRAVNHPVAWISKDELLLLKGYEVTT